MSQYFTQAYVLDPGGNGGWRLTFFFNLNLYKEGWTYNNMGYASALAWVMLIVVASSCHLHLGAGLHAEATGDRQRRAGSSLAGLTRTMRRGPPGSASRPHCIAGDDLPAAAAGWRSRRW